MSNRHEEPDMIEGDAQCYDLDPSYQRDHDWYVHDTRPFLCGCTDLPAGHHVNDQHTYDH